MRNYSIIFLKKAEQFTDNKEKELLASHDCKHPDKTWYFFSEVKLVFILIKSVTPVTDPNQQ